MCDKHSGSWSELLRGRNGLRSLALAGGVAVHAVNVYIATTILPSVVNDIGGLEYYAWNTTLFVVASILGSALSPKLIDGLGLRHAFLLAIAAFMLGTTVCAMSPSMPMLLLGRTVQGLGGGLLLSMSYSAVRMVFDERLWSRAMVLVSSMWGVATLMGPAIGGHRQSADSGGACPVVRVPGVAGHLAALERAFADRQSDRQLANDSAGGVGVGVGLCWPNLLTRVFKSAPKGQESIASAAITTLQLYAMAMGAALAGMVTNAAGFTQPGGMLGAQQAAAALCLVFACAPGLAAFLSAGARRAA